MASALLQFKKGHAPYSENKVRPHTHTPEFIERVRRENFYDKKSGRICGLTPLQYRTVEHFLKVNEKVLAVRMASKKIDIKQSSALDAASKIFGDELVLAYLDRRLREQGKISKALDTVSDGMDAKVIYKGEETDAPDHKTRLTAAKMILDLGKVMDVKKSAEEKVDKMDMEELQSLPMPILEWAYQHGRLPNKKEQKEIMDSLIDIGAEPVESD